MDSRLRGNDMSGAFYESINNESIYTNGQQEVHREFEKTVSKNQRAV
jgi:hypothetical protein